MQDMPRVTEQHRKLLALVGTWTGEEKMFPSPWDPKGGTALGRIEARADLDGFFVVEDYLQERDGKVSYRGHGVFGWDPKEERYTMHWFDSMGGNGTPPAKGRWEGNTLAFASQSPMGHSRYVYVFEGDGRIAFRIESSRDGHDWATFLMARYTRQSR
jgi:hypothetical protein